MTTPDLFSTLSHELGTRTARAVLSYLSPRSRALREHLRERLERPAGTDGSFLAPPVVEALFPWAQHDEPMEKLGFLHPKLVRSMDAPPKEVDGQDLRAERFGKDWHPYAHQVAAWRALGDPTPRSVLVSSGTSSGKTECFLVPILNALAEEADGVEGPLVGTRALFLYPLNALINSQRDRLLAWTHGFGDRLRFCLYNGNTPETLPAHAAGAPCEVKHRAELRRSPPPLLVTNATMLEYMLMRAEDRPIIEQSKGKLHTIVLDEAHTYIGSQAAEIALLLRRVLHAFEVEPKDVRFVATSATIGNEESLDKLGSFLAHLAGQPRDRVEVVTGDRAPPALGGAAPKRGAPPALDSLRAAPPQARFEAMVNSPAMQALRERLKEGPATLDEVAEVFEPAIEPNEVLEHLDLATTELPDHPPFLPTRTHFFLRTQAGLWACSNPNCCGRAEQGLAGDDWHLGAVFTERRTSCSHCRSRVLELVSCGTCGAEMLAGEIRGEGMLAPATWIDGDDDPEESLDAEDEAEEMDDGGSRYLVANLAGPHGNARATAYDPASGRLGGSGPAKLICVTDSDDSEPSGGRLRCPVCGELDRESRPLVRPARVGAPFHLGVAIPTVLDALPSEDGKVADLPFEGRRLITFNDSRQGTARVAARVQLAAERSYGRSAVYHQLLGSRTAGDARKVETLEEQLGRLRAAGPGFEVMAEDKAKELAEARIALEGAGKAELTWSEMRARLGRDTRVAKLIRGNLVDRYPPAADLLKEEEVAGLLLFREFARRPKRFASLETLGLVALTYPEIEKIAKVPTEAKGLGFEDVGEWRDFLSLCVDYFVRAHTGIVLGREVFRWMGTRISPTVILAPGGEGKKNRRYPFPREVRGSRPARMARLLFRAFERSWESEEDRDAVERVLVEAWGAIAAGPHAVLREEPDGYRLDLSQVAALTLLREGWQCGVTGRIHPRVLRGISPYDATDLQRAPLRCAKVRIPQPPPGTQYPRKERERMEALRDWLETDPVVAEARAAGWWGEFNDRVVEELPYFAAAEHSAQQPPERLQKLERAFKAKRLNVLSCSTTMEMGVNIGQLSAVGMNNAPPGPANFLQRAGRAGRRDSARAVSFTLCQSVPHGQAVFANPRWPFDTPVHVPSVSLQSEPIVRRHLHALFLGAFLDQVGQDGVRLQASWFFGLENDSEPPVTRMGRWLLGEAQEDSRLADGIRDLLTYTCLEGAATRDLAAEAEAQLVDMADRFHREVERLSEDVRPEEEVKAEDAPFQKALRLQLRRVTEEYLLKHLAQEGFLPGHGFPTDVLPFVNTTAELLANEREAREAARERRRQAPEASREDGLSRRRSYPTRSLAVAVREYAPGTSLVLDGLSYRSRGLTMHWKQPPGDHQQGDVQDLRWQTRCGGCGAVSDTRVQPQRCPACGAEFTGEDAVQAIRRLYLRPSGFAVDIGHAPDSDPGDRSFHPLIPPEVDAGGAWRALPGGVAGRFRHDPTGSVFHVASGAHGRGFAVCLSCGRADSEGTGTQLPSRLVEHRRLRRGVKDEKLCPGSVNAYALKRNVHLGGFQTTDVLELQLRNPVSGAELDDDTIASTIAVALRRALARELGVEDGEIGWATKAVHEGGVRRRSILLYDEASGGAGYVGQAADLLPRLLEDARAILRCPRGCDQACHGCLLAFDTQHALDRLDRHRGLAFLTEELLQGLALEPRLRAFGEDSQAELGLPLARMRQRFRAPDAALRLYLGGEVEGWEIETWPVWPDIGAWALAGRSVSLEVDGAAYDRLDDIDRRRLHQRAAALGVPLHRGPEGGQTDAGLPRLACIMGQGWGTVWSAEREGAVQAGPSWGRPDAAGRLVRSELREPLTLASSPIQPPPEPTGSDTFMVPLGAALDGDSPGFGARFWSEVTQVAPGLTARLAAEEPLTEVRYDDRYLGSPLLLHLVHRVMSHLSDVSGGIGPDTLVEVRTAAYPYRSRELRRVRDDYPQSTVRDGVAKALFGGPKPFAGGFVPLDRHDLPHHRRIELVWPSETWAIYLDEGFGFLRTRSSPRFDGERPSPEQAAQIRELSVEIFAPGDGSLAFVRRSTCA